MRLTTLIDVNVKAQPRPRLKQPPIEHDQNKLQAAELALEWWLVALAKASLELAHALDTHMGSIDENGTTVPISIRGGCDLRVAVAVRNLVALMISYFR